MSHGVHHRKLGLEVEWGLDPGTQDASMLSGGLTTVPTTCLPSGKFHMYIKEINNEPPPIPVTQLAFHASFWVDLYSLPF